jgi:hypothetical protein
MTDPITFILFDKVLTVLGLIREGKRRRTDKTEQALLALYAALAETKRYVQDQKNGISRDRDKEYAIAALWDKASVPLREIDIELADRCFLKGSYWREPGAWDQAQIEQKGIAIDAVFEATRALLIK